MPRNYFVVNKNRRPPVGGGPPGDFGKNLTGGFTPAGVLTRTLGGPPPPQNFTKSVIGSVRPAGILTRTLIVPPPAGNYPLMPSDCTMFARANCNVAPSSTSRQTIAGWVGRWGQSPASNSRLVVASDSTAPFSGPGCLDVVYPLNWSEGTEPVNMYGWHTGGGGTQFRKVYISWIVRVPTTTFEMHPSGIKLFGFIGAGLTPGTGVNSEIYMFLRGPGGSSLSMQSAGRLAFIQQSSGGISYVNRTIDQMAGTPTRFTFGPWHQVELLMETNPDVNVANGRVRVAVDNTLLISANNVAFRLPQAGKQSHIYDYKLNPTYGGEIPGVTLRKTRADRMRFDEIMIAGVPA